LIKIIIKIDSEEYLSIKWNFPNNLVLEQILTDENILHKTYKPFQYYYLGKVNGIGEIKSLYEKGLSPFFTSDESIACEEGSGYIISTWAKMFTCYIRLYIIEPILNKEKEIIGAKVKYQYPFKPEIL